MKRHLVKSHIAPLLFLAAITALAGLSACLSEPEGAGTEATSGASVAGSDQPSIARELPPVEGGRKILVVYFSQGSATRRVAEDLAFLLGADLERIVERKSRRGFFGIMGAGADSSMGRATPIEKPLLDPAAYDAVLVCSPVWAWHLSPPVRSWLQLFAGTLPEAAFVVVSANTRPDKILAMMEKEAGRAPSGWASFVEKDFRTENRAAYVVAMEELVARFR